MDLDTSLFLNRVSEYFHETPAECPYGRKFTAVYRQAYLGHLSGEILDIFLANGFRRNGNIIYSMNCRGCDSCIPIRISPREFRPGRNQRRVLKRNKDVTSRVSIMQVDDERLDLCNRFLNSRYPGKESSASDYYSGFFLNNIVDTVEISYRLNGKLVGISIVDLTATAMNAVYFYFDPDAGQRSLGSYNILYMLDLARAKGLDYVYLGYWIEDVQAMTYKARFRPHSLYRKGVWTVLGSDDESSRSE